MDTHIHAPQYAQMGLGTDRPLLEWLERYTFPTETRFADVEWARKVYEDVVRRTLRNGTTTACYFASLHTEASVMLARICEQLGQMAFVGKVCMDCNAPPTYCEQNASESLHDTQVFVDAVKALQSPIVAPVITPRFAITCTSELLRGLGNMAQQQNLLVQTHLCENKKEIAFTKELFPHCRDYASVYAEAGLLRKNQTVLAHCVHMTGMVPLFSHVFGLSLCTDLELALLAATGAGVAHCPRSNLTLGSGLCHVRRLQQAGVAVALGTDVSGGPYPSIWDAMRGAVETSQAIHFVHEESAALSYREAFYLGTQGGANVLGLGDTLGSFREGKWFNAQVLDASVRTPLRSSVIVFHELPLSQVLDCYGTESVEDLFQKLFWLLDDRCIEQVYVKGRKVI